MARRREKDKHLPPYLYIVKRRRPYKLVRPDGSTRSFANFQDAIAEWATWYGPETESCLASRLMDEYLARHVPKLRERTQKDYAHHISFLRPALGHNDIRHITPALLYDYQAQRGQTSVHQANRELAVMSNVFKLAIRKGLMDHNPCKNVSRLPEYPRERDVTVEEFGVVFERAEPVIQVAMMLTAITGIREGDMLALSRTAVSEDGLRYVESKSQRTAEKRGGRKRHWEWSPNLRWCLDTALSLHPPKNPSIYLLHIRGHRKRNFYAAWRRAMDRAIEDGKLAERYTFHDLRAFAANEAQDPFELLAHSDGSVTIRHYTNRRARTTKPVK